MLDLENDLERFILPGNNLSFYQNSYSDLINSCRIRGLRKIDLDFYTETHHILPRCMGGSDEDSNLVLLTPLEHLVAHILLLRLDEDNLKHIHSVRCFLDVSHKDIHRGYLSTINEFIKLAAELRERIGVSVVCYDDNLTIYRVYKKISDVKIDNFEPTTISRAAEGFYNKGYGYNWCYLDKFIDTYPDKFNSFIDNFTSLDVFRFRRVICTDINNNIIAIFNRTSLAAKIGFSEDGISFCITRPSEVRHTGGYRWYRYTDFLNLFPEKLSQFEMIHGSVLEYESKYPPGFSPIEVDNRVVCLGRNKKLLKAYRNAKEVILDGIHDNSISPVLMGKRDVSAGYYWQKVEDFLKNNPNITSNDVNNYLDVELNQYVVVSDVLTNKIVKIYKNAIEPIKDKLHTKYVSHALLGIRESYAGYYWTRLEDWKDIGQLEEYFKNHPEDKP